MKRAWPWVVAVVTVVYAIHVYRYRTFLCDDSLISLRYSERLVDGRGLTWNDDQRVEGYSNLLWVLACAAVGLLRIDLLEGSRGLGVICMFVAVVSIMWTHARGDRKSVLAAGFGGLALALASPICVWAIAGLEQPLVAALLAYGVARVWRDLDEEPSSKQLAGTGLVLGLLAWTRPDGALFPAVIGASAMAVRLLERRSFLRYALVALPGLALVGLQLLFRYFYYDDVVPNTAHVKLLTAEQLIPGGKIYVSVALAIFLPLVVMAGLALLGIRDAWLRRRVLTTVVPLVAWLLYLVRIGGDIFPAHRHHVPSVVLLAFVASAYVARQEGRVPLRSLLTGCALALGFVIHAELDDPFTENARTEKWEWDCKRIAETFGRAYRAEKPLFAVDAAGCLPYFSHLPSLDMVGLNDRFIARHPPKDVSLYPHAHNFGHAPYVLHREPDVVAFCGPLGNPTGCWPSGIGLTASAMFHERYRLSTFGLDDLRWSYWLRFEGGRIGVQRTQTEVTIPAHFFTASAHPVTFDGDHPVVRGDPSTPFRIEEVSLPAGHWVAHPIASAPIARVSVLGPGVVPTEGGFDLAEETRVDIEIVPTADAALRSLSFSRQ